MPGPGSKAQSQRVITKRGKEAMTGSNKNRAVEIKKSHR